MCFPNCLPTYIRTSKNTSSQEAYSYDYVMTEKRASKPGLAPGNRVVIGVSLGNSNSSIAHTVEDKADVIANEDGGETSVPTL